ncbi:MAG: hypothetical protein K2K54_10345 [Lachnospiraceae bacterium]|nr:hypothetical protein [Lachnospiraceae bacterium]
MKFIKKNIFLAISVLFIFLILLQHHYVYMYFDDYGYASLSYINSENQIGRLFGLTDVFQFLWLHYLKWGGRILYLFWEIILMRIGGLKMIQLVQAAIIILTGVVSGKIVSKITQADCNACIAFSLLLYGTIQIKTLRDGVYWYSASVLYVWPLLPLLVAAYLCIEEKESKSRKALCILLTFLAAFSQEQIAVMTITLNIFFIFFRYIKKCKSGAEAYRLPKYMIGMCISAVAGGILVICAPGNTVRAEAGIYDSFYHEKIVVRTIKNIGLLINNNVGSYNWVFILFLTLFCGMAAAIYLKSRGITAAVFVFSMYFVIENFLPVSKEVGVIIRGIWILIFLPAIILYYLKRQSYFFLSILSAGLCSQGMMILSPTVPVRSHIMMEFVLHMVLMECTIYLYREFGESKKKQIILKIGIAVLTLYAVCNLCFISVGYKNNYGINQKNHDALLKAQEQYENEETVTEVILYRLKDDTYANMMPYQKGYGFI